VHVPLFTAFAPPAITFRLAERGAKVVVADEHQRDKLDQAAAFPPDRSYLGGRPYVYASALHGPTTRSAAPSA